MLSDSRQPDGSLGSVLRALRTRYGLSQTALSERSQTDRSHISKVENRPAEELPRVKPEQIAKWGRALGRTDQERRENTDALLRAAGYLVDSPSPEVAAEGDTRLDQAIRRAIREELRPADAPAVGDAAGLDIGPVLLGFTRARQILPAETYRQLVALITNQVPMVTDLLARGELGPTRYRSDQSDDEEAG